MSLKDLTTEEEEKLINKLANEIVKRELEFPASILFEIYQPVAPYVTTLGFYSLFPILMLLGDTGFDYSSLFMKRENIEKLRNKIEEKKVERDKKKESDKNKKKDGRSGNMLGWLKRKKTM